MAGIEFRTVFTGTAVTSTEGDDGADLVYTVPAGHDCQVTFLMICNETNGTDKISIEIYHAQQDAWYDLCKNARVNANEFTEVIGSSRLFLHEGDKIAAYVQQNNDAFHVTMSAKLFYNPNTI